MSAPPRGPELDALTRVAATSIAPVSWHDENVITTELLAKAYGTESVRIRQNLSRNSDRFVEGKHYYRLEGDELKQFKDNRVSSSDSQIPSRARSVILWTERGAARHAKMLETEAAWDVFESLEDNYFRRRAGQDSKPEQDEAKISTVRDREPLLHAAISMVVKHHLPFHKVYQTMNYFAGSPKFAEMTKSQAAEAEQFVERLLLGNDTRQDWLRIGENKRDLSGGDSQPELLGFVVPGTLGNR